ncbi:deaminated glutathione amidase [Winslowiella iniecta]|uniref:Hydrolase n=1 Tax=Winslowiella iniecta TaxID=1560201 RepID=A0A0L7T2G2_9GAMM|nr:deaminated glutathione amidase [Winslowiella iniecta]KOC89411.1 hydrolase [Winslowiella iniecta]KOC93427.1 hydrolase [Winslowiella iniecta]
MKIAMGQFAVERDWQHNAATCIRLMSEAAAANARLLVLPEAVLARDNTDADFVLKAAQTLDGPFVSQLLAASRNSCLTTIMSVPVPTAEGRALNVLIAIHNGEIVARYDKLHLYDAFAVQESKNITAGEQVPALIEIDGMKVGLMTCYDVRFPELARRLAVDGADVLVLPSAWLRGPLKEMHWEVLVTARALENTCYLIAVGECGPRNIGNSLVVDPLGVAIAKAAEAPALVFADLDVSRLAYARSVLPVLENRRFARPELKSS